VTADARGVRRALTPAGLDAIVAAIDNAASVAETLQAALRGTYNALLSERGQTVDDYDAANRLDPSAFAIPAAQWEAIAQAIANRAQEWAASATIALDVINLIPSSYDDPAAPVPKAAAADRRPPAHELRVSREAVDVIAACEAHVHALGDYYGHDSPEFLTALRSWHQQLARLFNMGLGAYTRVAKDGDLALLVTTASGLIYGIVFHGTQRRCLADDCHARINDDGTVHSASAETARAHDHTPSYPLDGPRPGQWSAHS
jgi:hypothetical protein